MKKITDFVNEGRDVDITDFKSLMRVFTEAFCGSREDYNNLMSNVDFFLLGNGEENYGDTVKYRVTQRNGSKILCEVTVKKH